MPPSPTKRTTKKTPEPGPRYVALARHATILGVVSQAFRPRERPRKRALARVTMTERLLEDLHEHGRLHVVLSSEAAQTTAEALDGSGARLFLGASGRPTQLLLNDLVDPEEDREVHFPTVTLSIRWREDELSIFASAGSGRVDPWADRPAVFPRARRHST